MSKHRSLKRRRQHRVKMEKRVLGKSNSSRGTSGSLVANMKMLKKAFQECCHSIATGIRSAFLAHQQSRIAVNLKAYGDASEDAKCSRSDLERVSRRLSGGEIRER